MIRIIILLALLSALPARAAGSPDFDREVAPLLARRCLDCHSGASPRAASIFHAASPRWPLSRPGSSTTACSGTASAMTRCRPRSRCRPGSVPLRDWIAGGATWGSDPIDPFRITTDSRAGYDWWSLRPIVPMIPPAVRNPAWSRNADRSFRAGEAGGEGLAAFPRGRSPNVDSPAEFRPDWVCRRRPRRWTLS